MYLCCGGRIRTFDSRINNPVPYQLGYATTKWMREQESNLPMLAYETSEPPLLYSRVNPDSNLEAMKGVEPLSSGLQDRRSVIQLSYIAVTNWWTGRDSNPHKKFAGLLC